MSETLSELSESLDLEFLFDRESIAYKGPTRGSNGDQFNLERCPECGDDRSRVYLNAETGLGNCFVCSEGFNKLTFVHAYLGHGKSEWGKTIAFVKDVLKDQGWRPRRVISVATDDTPVALPTSFELPLHDGQNLAYLVQRGLDDALTRYFRLRYCEDAWWNWTRPDGTRGGQNFGDRVIIPVYDLDGGLVTFQGRDLTGTSDKKYLFPAGLPGTGRFLYNGHNAQRMKRVAMGEGAFDVIGLKIACDLDPSLRDIVPIGSFGKHLSYGDPNGNDQLGRFLQLKAGGLEEVIIAWDGEASALVAALDAAKLLRSIGLRAKIALLPAGKDPNEASHAEVQAAIHGATLYTPAVDIRWRLRTPYRSAA